MYSSLIRYYLFLLFSISAYAQTPEQELQQCVLKEIESYQPISDYSENFSCDVDNKKDPFDDPPSKGPNLVSIRYDGFIFLDARANETSKISDGGHTAPYISPRRDEVSSTIWCRAEDKLFGAGGHYSFVISGKKQRVATKIENRKALQKCSKQISGLWNITSK